MNPLILQAHELLKDTGFAYCICGGFALDMFARRELRKHGDFDISVFKHDRRKVVDFLQANGWPVYARFSATEFYLIDNWTDEQLAPYDNMWAVKPDSFAKMYLKDAENSVYSYRIHEPRLQGFDFIEISFNTLDGDYFTVDDYPKMRRKMDKAVLFADGIPYLAPELVLFLKSPKFYTTNDYLGPKTATDFPALMPLLPEESRKWLMDALDATYPNGYRWLNFLPPAYTIAPIVNHRLKEMATLQMNAYPGFTQGVSFEDYAQRIEKSHARTDVNYYGVNTNGENGKMIGGFNVWDFNLNMRQSMIKAGGLGSVAVDLCYKKEKVCREIMRNFLQTLRNNGRNMAMLYPFNSAFYKKMGFGFGTLLQQLRLKPEDLPGDATKVNIVCLTDDSKKLAEFYNSRVKVTHGLCLKSESEFATRLANPAVKIFAHMDEGEIHGYIVCSFKRGSEENVLTNDLVITEMLFDSPQVFAELMSFLNSQSDQVRYVIFNTQDEGFINTIADPRNHMERMLTPIYQEVCRTGLGIMYRICDIRAFFADIASVNFGGLNMNVLMYVTDSFVPENNRTFNLKFENGHCTIDDTAEPDVKMVIDIAELSSVVMGSVNLKQLVKYGKVKCGNMAKLDELSRAFALDEKPICLSQF